MSPLRRCFGAIVTTAAYDFVDKLTRTLFCLFAGVERRNRSSVFVHTAIMGWSCDMVFIQPLLQQILLWCCRHNIYRADFVSTVGRHHVWCNWVFIHGIWSHAIKCLARCWRCYCSNRCVFRSSHAYVGQHPCLEHRGLCNLVSQFNVVNCKYVLLF